jgi:uncharacterized membrane protein
MNNQISEKSTLGLDANLAAALGYPIGLIGLVNFIIEKQNRFVKFHGIQSVLYSLGLWVGFFVLWIVVAILGMMLAFVSEALGFLVVMLSSLLLLVVGLVWFGGLLFFAYKAYQGQMFKLPVIGNLADKLTGS